MDMNTPVISIAYCGDFMDLKFELKYVWKTDDTERTLLDEYAYRFPLFRPKIYESNYQYMWIPYAGDEIVTGESECLINQMKQELACSDEGRWEDLEFILWIMWLKAMKVDASDTIIEEWRKHKPHKIYDEINNQLLSCDSMHEAMMSLKSMEKKYPIGKPMQMMLCPKKSVNSTETQQLIRILADSEIS